MYARWPFFRTLVDRAGHGAREDGHGHRGALRGAGPRSQAAQDGVRVASTREHDDTLAAFFAITQTTALLENNPSLARSLRNRIPYIDPLSHLQVDLLRRLRSGRGDAEELRRAVHLTINGVAAGLRNSG